MVVMVTGPSFQNIGFYTYVGEYTIPVRFGLGGCSVIHNNFSTVFAALNAFIIPIVYFFFPETAGRSLEGAFRHFSVTALFGYMMTDSGVSLVDMDLIFAISHRENVSPVAVSLRKDLPIAGTPEADEILGIQRTTPRNEKEPPATPQSE